MELTKALNRAARGLLGWSLPVQAEKSGVALRKLRDLEQGRNNRLDLRAEEQALEAFRDAGVDFLAEENGSGAGVIFLERQGRESDCSPIGILYQVTFTTSIAPAGDPKVEREVNASG